MSDVPRNDETQPEKSQPHKSQPGNAQTAAGRSTDAVVIPIGTSGRPGRGAGQAKPSSAARRLAPRSRGAAAATDPTQAAAEPASAAPEPSTTSVTNSMADTEVPIRVVEPPTVENKLKGVPLSDWLAAIKLGASEVFGDQWERKLAEFLAFLRHRLNGHYAVDEYGFDPELTQRLFMAILRPIAQKWFRIEVRGTENIPESGGALVVSNHSGTVPVDGLMSMVSTFDATGRHLRPLAADLVFQLPLVSSMARKGGATLACQPDAERMLRAGELVAVWPEGFKGIGKPFSERYKLQRFGRGGFVSAALRTGVPIVPLSVVGAEEIYPLVGNIPSLARLLGLPYIPITPLFPLLGPLGLIPLPSKWILEFGEPIRTDAYDEAEADDPMLVFEITDQVRESIQQTLYKLLRQRGGVFS